MTRDMYESLKITDLRAIAKQRGISAASRSRKSELIDAMMALDAQEAGGVAAGRSTGAAGGNSAGENPAEVPADAQTVSGRGRRTHRAVGTDEGASAAESMMEETAGETTQYRSDAGQIAASDETAANATAAETASAEADETDRTRAVHRRTRTGETHRTGEAGEPHRTERRRSESRTEVHRTEARRGEKLHRNEKRPAHTAAEAGEGRAENPRTAGRRAAVARGVAESRNPESRVAYEERDAASREGNSTAGVNTGNYTTGTQNTPVAAVRDGAPAPAVNAASAALAGRYERRGLARPDQPVAHKNELNKELDSGELAHGILEVMQDGFGFIRSSNYMPGDDDVYVAPSQIRRFNLKTGDVLEGNIRVRTSGEKFSALLFVKSVNGMDPEVARRRFNFEDMTPIFPDERIRLEQPTCSVAMRVMDLFCPVGKGQRGMIVSPPKAGKTTLVKEVAKSVKKNNPEIHLIILLIDERPEEVTDIKEALEGPNVEVIYSTFDELPEHHKRVSEMTIERAKRLVEQKQDVMILLDSITRLTRAYNMTEPSSGRTLSGGLDPVALHAPKRFFGAARNMREGGSLTILATALIETGSKMDDVVYEEFKGTGNMEVILNRKLSERRIFPAIDLAKSGTRRDDLLLTPDEMDAVSTVRRAFIGSKGEEATDTVLDLFAKTRTNGEFVSMIRRHSWAY